MYAGVMETASVQSDHQPVLADGPTDRSPLEESPPLPRTRLGSIVKIKPRKSHPPERQVSKLKELDTISHLSKYSVRAICLDRFKIDLITSEVAVLNLNIVFFSISI